MTFPDISDLATTLPGDESPGTSIDVGSFNLLDASHSQMLEQAIRRVLATDVAEQTYAQIIDGLPTTKSHNEFMGYYREHLIVMLKHEDLCPGVLEKTQQFRANFDLSSLQFPLTPLLAFQDAETGTKAFHLRLIELVAVACHQIAVYLYSLDDGVHKHAQYEAWRDGPRDKTVEPRRAPIAFCHRLYVAISKYPNGDADCAGYWAEAKIFGGVVIFDRGESEKECNDLFLHPGGYDGPKTIYALTQEQFANFILFLESPDEAAALEACPLPMNVTHLNRYRWHQWDAFARYHIFRDKHERTVSPTKPQPVWRCVRSTHHFPEESDELLLLKDLYQEASGEPVNEREMAEMWRRMRQITPSSPNWRPGMVWRGVTYGVGEGDEKTGIMYSGFKRRLKELSQMMDDAA